MNKTTTLLAAVFLTMASYAQDIPVTKLNLGTTPQTGFKNTFVVHGGDMYFAPLSFPGKLYHYRNGWQELTPANSGIAASDVKDIQVFNDQFYFATEEGISILKGSAWEQINTQNSNLAEDDIFALFVSDAIIVAAHNRGFSYRLKGETTWNNIDKSSFPKPVLINERTESVLYKDGVIYLLPNPGRELIRYDILADKTTLIPGPKRDLALGKDHIFTFNDSRYIQILDDTLYDLTSKGICDLSIQWDAFNFRYTQNIFTDNQGQFWHMKRSFSGIPNFSTVEDQKYIQITRALPLTAKLNTEHIIAYDAKTDSMYSLTDQVAFAMSDVRKTIGKRPKNLALLDINEVSTPISNGGDQNWDPNFLSERYEVPKGACKSPLFSSGLWIGGTDDDDKLHTAAMTYRQRGKDFWPGPLKTDGSYDADDTLTYDRVWKVNKGDINLHKKVYDANGQVKENETAEAIWNWPGNGKAGYDSKLAPFIDLNSNGIYEPAQGDYPDIPGDQCIYWIMNDVAYPHSESQGDAFGVEIHGMAYAYNCPDLDASQAKYGVNQTTFYRYKIINKGNQNYKGVVVGMFADVDLGNFSDDYVGCHVTQNMGYVYNGDFIDEADRGYGTNPPMLSVALLKAPAFEHDGVDGDGDGMVDEEDEKRLMGGFTYYDNDQTNFGNPSTAIHYNNYLNSKWKNGDPFTYDQLNGRTGTEVTKYIFPANTNPKFKERNWTESVAGNTPADRRFLVNTYPFDLDKNDTANYEYAIIFSHDKSKAEQLDKNLDYLNAVKKWYFGSGDPGCSSLSVRKLDQQESFLGIYPNPAQTKVTLRSEYAISEVRIYTMSGQLLRQFNTDHTNSLDIDLSDFKVGAYILDATTESGHQKARLLKW